MVVLKHFATKSLQIVYRQTKVTKGCLLINIKQFLSKGEEEDYFMLCDSLPEEKALRERLKIFKLVSSR
jgi:hypothetical protein